MHNSPLMNHRTRVEKCEEERSVYTDLNKPDCITGLNDEKYFSNLIDDFCKAAQVRVNKPKVEVYKFVKYVNLIENETDKKIKKLWCNW